MPHRDRNGHWTRAGRFCDNDFLIHVLPFPGSKIHEYAPAYSIMGVHRTLVAIVAQCFTKGLPVLMRISDTRLKRIQDASHLTRPGVVSPEHAPAYSIMGVYRPLIGTIIAQCFAQGLPVLMRISTTWLKRDRLPHI